MVHALVPERSTAQRTARRPLPRAEQRPEVRPSAPRSPAERGAAAAAPVASSVPARVASPRAQALAPRAEARGTAPSVPVVSPEASAARAPALSVRPLRGLRGYEDSDLMAIAEIGYHYLMSGALDLARIVFEGLHAIAPDEAYFALALGLVRDREGDKRGAAELYARAGRLHPNDPRPDINRAELHIERGELLEARRLLECARGKALRTGDDRMELKAEALLRHLRAAAPAPEPTGLVAVRAGKGR